MGITVQFNSYEEMVEFAGKLIGEVQDPVKKIKKAVEKPVKEETTVQEETVVEETGTQEEETAVTYSLEEVRARCTELIRSGKQKEVKEILTAVGAKQLTGVDPKDYVVVMEKAGEL